MENKIKKSIDAFIAKDDEKAEKYFNEAIRQSKKYIEYKNLLQEYGLDMKQVDIPNDVFTDIQQIIKEYDKPLQLKIIDEVYFAIAKSDV